MGTVPNATGQVTVNNTRVKPTCRLDEIMIEQKAKGENYADWQAHRYPVKVEVPRTIGYQSLSKGEY